MNEEYQTRQFFGNCDSTNITYSITGGYWAVTNCQRFGPQFSLFVPTSYEYTGKEITGTLKFICDSKKE